MAVSNGWLFAPLLRQRLAGDPAAQALLGTTIAPTMIDGGVRPNVLPGEATAMINFRIHPRDSAADLLRRARQQVADLEGVTVDWDETPREASGISSTTSTSLRADRRAFASILPMRPWRLALCSPAPNRATMRRSLKTCITSSRSSSRSRIWSARTD